MIGHNPFRLRSQPRSIVQLLSTVSSIGNVYLSCACVFNSVLQATYGAAAVLHVLELVITPPTRYPDLFAVLNVLVCTPVFVLVWLWSIKCGVEVSWAMGGLGSVSKGRELERKAEGDVGVYQTGARLTDGEGRRRAHFSSRASSVGPDLQND